MENKVSTKIISVSDLTKFNEAIAQANNQTLAIFDIDEVIFTSQDQVLHPNYRKYRNSYEEKYLSNLDASVSQNLNYVMYKTRSRTIVDPKILDIFKLIASNYIQAIALTHCSTGFIDGEERYELLRIEQLKNFGIDFNALARNIADTSFPEIAQDHGIPLFHKGVILTGLVDKGRVLKEFLMKTRIKPNKIIFIDDMMENLLSVEETCNELAIEFQGYEYNAVANTISPPFNDKLAQIQFDHLVKNRIWLNDSDAQKELDNILKKSI